MLVRSALSFAVFSLLSWAVVASAQSDDPVGSIATMEGTVEIGRQGAWAAAEVGTELRTGDQVRTGTPGRARLVFRDDTVIAVSDGSLFTIDLTVAPQGTGPMHFLLDLVVGKVRALVSEYYREPQASFEIQTATAVSAVRGTEFVVSYDSRARLTEVLGIGGTVSVHGVIDRLHHGVSITRLMLTKVAKGKYPTPPQLIRLDDENYRRLLSGVDFVANGAPESVSQQAAAVPVVPQAAMKPSPTELPPTVSVGESPVDRTPSQIIQQPTAPLGNGAAHVEF